MENQMSDQIYPVSGTVNKLPSPGPSPERMGQSRWPDGEVEEQAAVLEWLPVVSLASFLCPVLQKRLRALKSDFWEPTAPVTARSESGLPHAGKDRGYGAAPASAAGLVCPGKQSQH